MTILIVYRLEIIQIQPQKGKQLRPARAQNTRTHGRVSNAVQVKPIVQASQLVARNQLALQTGHHAATRNCNKRPDGRDAVNRPLQRNAKDGRHQKHPQRKRLQHAARCVRVKINHQAGNKEHHSNCQVEPINRAALVHARHIKREDHGNRKVDNQKRYRHRNYHAASNLAPSRKLHIQMRRQKIHPQRPKHHIHGIKPGIRSVPHYAAQHARATGNQVAHAIDHTRDKRKNNQGIQRIAFVHAPIKTPMTIHENNEQHGHCH